MFIKKNMKNENPSSELMLRDVFSILKINVRTIIFQKNVCKIRCTEVRFTKFGMASPIWRAKYPKHFPFTSDSVHWGFEVSDYEGVRFSQLKIAGPI